jgi:hypothetical protein
MWSAIRGTKNLRKLELFGWPTSSLVGLSSVPQITTIKMTSSEWDLDDLGKSTIAQLQNVSILFQLWTQWAINDTKKIEEVAFWKSLPFVTVVGKQ